MTEPKPAPMNADQYRAFRRERELARASAESLVPVEGGEPIPAEEPPPAKRSKTF